MTIPTTIALATTLAVGASFYRPPFQVTLITHAVSPEGLMLAEPIYTPSLALWPENSVARAINPGEALRCVVGQEKYPAVVRGEDAEVSVITFDCDGARFTLRGLQFERTP